MTSEDSTYFLMLNSELNGISFLAILVDEVMTIEEIKVSIHKSHTLNSTGCLNIHLSINVANGRKARTESVYLCLPRRYRTPKVGDIYVNLRTHLKILTVLSNSEIMGSSSFVKIQSY